jgi:phosphate transport system protein
MKIHLQKETDNLKKKLFHLSTMVEESLEQAIRAIYDQDLELAAAVKERDKEIDRLEVEVEEDCLKILALHQPVAADLRFLITALKMNNDLERIGDLAVNITNGKLCLAEENASPVFGERVKNLGGKARQMLRDSLQTLMDLNNQGARQVLAADDEVDADYRDFLTLLKKEMAAHPEKVDVMICWMLIAKHIERVADLATNIAEDTIYTITGEIVRHGRR